MDAEFSSADQLNDRISRDYAPVQMNWAADDFSASMRFISLSPDVAISDKHSSGGFQIERTDRLVHDSRSADMIFFSVKFAGLTTFDQHDRRADVRAGDGVFHESAHRVLVTSTMPDHAIDVVMSRRLLLDAVGAPVPVAVPISSADPMMRVLRSTLREISASGIGLTEADRDTLSHVTVDLVSTLARSVAIGRTVNPTGRDALLRQLREDIRVRLGDPALGPSDLAARHHISVRYVHSLFRAIDTSPASYIREARLQAADRMLVNPRHDDRLVAAIGHELGFSDASTFVRAYRRRFAMTPTDRRATRGVVATRGAVDLNKIA